ncbi:unnamed protein product [Scytosiphon promiscuus]
MTALALAAFHGHPSVVTILLRNGADLSTVDGKGPTSLHLAASRGHLAAVLRAGAVPRSTSTNTPRGASVVALDVAAIHGHSAVVGKLIQQCGIKICGGASGGAEAIRLVAIGPTLGCDEHAGRRWSGLTREAGP